MRKSIILFLLFLSQTFVSLQVFSQDSTKNPITNNFSFLVTGGLYYQHYAGDEVLMPDYQKRLSMGVDQTYYTADQPIFHGASFMDIGASYTTSGFRLNARLIGEHIGQSYGVYDKNAIRVYPKYLASLDSGFSLLGYDLRFGVSVGNYDNIRTQQGLTAYNIDVQGSRWYASVDKFIVSYQKIGDLFRWIGLNINDVNTWSFKFDNIEVLDDIFISPEYSYINTQGGYHMALLTDLASMSDHMNSYSLSIRHKDNLSAYFELADRIQMSGYDPIDDTKAFLAGVSFNYESTHLILKTHGEYRQYGKAFNIDYYDPQFANDSGDVPTRYKYGDQYFYPTQLFDRPFSQWAVFTEYQQKNVEGLTFYIDAKVPIWEGIFVKGMLDWNKIYAEEEEPFTYPFYNLGIGWEPFKGVFGMYSMTNRGMNMTKPYPTLYLYKEPTYQLQIYWSLKF